MPVTRVALVGLAPLTRDLVQRLLKGLPVEISGEYRHAAELQAPADVDVVITGPGADAAALLDLPAPRSVVVVAEGGRRLLVLELVIRRAEIEDPSAVALRDVVSHAGARAGF